MAYPTDENKVQYLSTTKATEWATARTQKAIDSAAINMVATGQFDLVEDAEPVAEQWAKRAGIQARNVQDIEERFHIVSDELYAELLRDQNSKEREALHNGRESLADSMTAQEKAMHLRAVLQANGIRA